MRVHAWVSLLALAAAIEKGIDAIVINLSYKQYAPYIARHDLFAISHVWDATAASLLFAAYLTIAIRYIYWWPWTFYDHLGERAGQGGLARRALSEIQKDIRTVPAGYVYVTLAYVLLEFPLIVAMSYTCTSPRFFVFAMFVLVVLDFALSVLVGLLKVVTNLFGQGMDEGPPGPLRYLGGTLKFGKPFAIDLGVALTGIVVFTSVAFPDWSWHGTFDEWLNGLSTIQKPPNWLIVFYSLIVIFASARIWRIQRAAYTQTFAILRSYTFNSN